MQYVNASCMHYLYLISCVQKLIRKAVVQAEQQMLHFFKHFEFLQLQLLFGNAALCEAVGRDAPKPVCQGRGVAGSDA